MKQCGAVVVVVMLSLAGVCAGELDYSAESEVYFSSVASRDRIRATVAGTTCKDSTFHLTIESADGDELYHYDLPLTNLLPCDVREFPKEQVTKAATSIVSGAVSVVRTNSLGCEEWRSRGGHGCWAHPELARIQRASNAAVCFNTTNDSRMCVAYDPQTKRVERVHSFGL